MAYGREYTCTRCGHVWHGRTEAEPTRCPACKSPYFDRPRRQPATKR